MRGPVEMLTHRGRIAGPYFTQTQTRGWEPPDGSYSRRLAVFDLWAKTARDGSGGWHPLVYHLLDVGACCEAILAVHPARVRRMAAILGVEGEALGSSSVLLAALHDIGKCAVGFQGKVPALWPASLGPMPATIPAYRHDAGGQWILSRHLEAEVMRLFPGLSGSGLESVLSACCFHHGEPADLGETIRDHDTQIGSHALHVSTNIAGALVEVLCPKPCPVDRRRAKLLSWWLSGLMVLSDWLGSNSNWFPFRSPDVPLEDYWRITRKHAAEALRASGMVPATVSAATGFDALYGHLLRTATPLQKWASTAPLPDGPTLVAIEDATGAGKTEAAIVMAHRLMLAQGYTGLHIGLPTAATANAMYGRLGGEYRGLFEDGPSEPSLALAHGGAQQVRADVSEIDGSIFCADWIARSNKTSFLAQVGSATIDQALLAVLPVRHQSLRLWGLLDRVLIVDEAHAYDAYMQRELETVLEFQASLGGAAIILSATLPAVIKRRLVEAWQRGLGQRRPSWQPASTAYPMSTMVGSGAPVEAPVCLREGLDRAVRVRRVDSPLEAYALALEASERGAAVCIVRNTVTESIETYEALRAAGARDLTLFHARFTAGRRARIESEVLDRWGPGDRLQRSGILVATQVVEQSLDIDFDLLITDLAPIDLLIQRAGRLWRHRRDRRPVGGPLMLVISPEPGHDAPASWPAPALPRTAMVYRHKGTLWRSARTLFAHGVIATRQVRELVEAVYGANAEPAPEGLAEADVKARGRQSADRTKGMYVTLRRPSGYVWDGEKWGSEEHARTRLGEPSVTLRLARHVGGRLEPMCGAWRDSEVNVRESQCSTSANAPAVDPIVETLRRDWTISEQEMPVIALEHVGGAWVGAGRRESGPVRLTYTSETGLKIENRR